MGACPFLRELEIKESNIFEFFLDEEELPGYLIKYYCQVFLAITAPIIAPTTAAVLRSPAEYFFGCESSRL